MKGMVFAGCSFTWGEGLYFYHDMDKSHIPLKQKKFDESKLKSKDFLYKDTLRFPRLVANHFNTFEIVQWSNGGSDDSSVYFINEVLNIHETDKLCDYKFDFDDIEYVIIQTTQPQRSTFQFTLDNKKYTFQIGNEDETYYTWNKHGGKVVKNEKEKFLLWLEKHNHSIDDGFRLINEQILQRFKVLMEFLESKNIKPKILSWTNDYIDLIKNDDYFNDKFIHLNYDNKKFDCIDDLFEYDKSLRITHDSDKKIEVENDHPSKKCHQIIAKSVISKIKNG